jgi:hypothetical protein
MLLQYSSIKNICFLYIAILLRYFCFDSGFLQFIFGSALVTILVWLNFCGRHISDEVKDLSKFVGHLLFLYTSITLFFDSVNFVYALIFYFGFINTLIFLAAVYSLFASNFFGVMRAKCYEKLSKYSLGRIILNLINTIYNVFLLWSNLLNRVYKLFEYIIFNVVWNNLIQLLYIFININRDLGDNKQSNNVKNEIYKQFGSAQSLISEKFIMPMLLGNFQNSLSQNDFVMPPLSKMQYKNNMTNSDINMSFLAKNKINNNEVDDLDDLDEPVITNRSSESSESVESPKSEKTSETSDSVKTANLTTTTEQTTEMKKSTDDNKAALRKKLAAQKAARRGGMPTIPNNQRDLQQNMESLMEVPGMSEMMKLMLKDNNLGNLMKQVTNRNIDQEELNDFKQNFNKKK